MYINVNKCKCVFQLQHLLHLFTLIYIHLHKYTLIYIYTHFPFPLQILDICYYDCRCAQNEFV